MAKKQYSDQLKRDAVAAMAARGDRTIPELARQLGIVNPNSIIKWSRDPRWKAKNAKTNGVAHPRRSPERLEVQAAIQEAFDRSLNDQGETEGKEVRRLRKENVQLRRALAVFVS